MMKRKEHEKGNLEPIPGKLLHVLLPYDMEVETLSRLAGKSLMKFLCVSKTWSSLIRSQRFVASYYAAKPSRFVVAFTNSACSDPKRLFILSGEEEATSSSSCSSLVANLDMTIPSVTLPHGAYKYFSVHGFIACFELSNFIICNPSTGQVVTFYCKAPGTSLGYDPVDDQFKALTQVTSNYDHNPSVMVHEVINTWTRRSSVSNERILSFITTPQEVLVWQAFTSLIEYKGKPAVVVPICLGEGGYAFDRFNLWILEDVTKHEWSKQTFELSLSLPFTLGMGQRMISQGTNKAGEIIFSPTSLPSPSMFSTSTQTRRAQEESGSTESLILKSSGAVMDS
ncbi:F-box protein At1g30790 [Brassica rapa]|uniref:F-box protein At1g30790 n=1 Tax=Brassica campestris TaxID=3711 RepID=UPI0004F14696|nr:F-box protein At1g30790 [Brassica rapa]